MEMMFINFQVPGQLQGHSEKLVAEINLRQYDKA